MPIFGGLARLAAIASLAGVASQAPPEKKTQPLACTGTDDPALQLVTIPDAWEFHTLDAVSGDRSVLWRHSKADNAEVKSITSCGIGAKDRMAYCIIQHVETWCLARVDGDGFAFVARTPPGGKSGGGTCDEEGAFLAVMADRIWRLADIDTLVGASKPWDDMPQMEDFAGVSPEHGKDLVVWAGWLVSISNEPMVVMTDLADSSLATQTPSREGGDELPKATFGTAYMQGGDMYFLANVALGLFRLELNPAAGSYTATRVGESFLSTQTDGLYCVFPTVDPSSDGVIKDVSARAAMPTALALIGIVGTMLA